MSEIVGNLTITKNRSEQKINLRELLGQKPSSSQIEEFAKEAIEVINQRTLNGEDINGDTFAPYSEAYAKKKGVSVDSVDLFLTGDMLNSIDKTNSTRDTVTIGIIGGEAAKKSYYHNKDAPKIREFFGITRNEAEQIAAKIREERRVEKEATKPTTTLAELLRAINLIDIEVE